MNLNIDQRLRLQNDGHSWRDCNDAGLPHRWVADQVDLYWRCTRCPVATRHEHDGFKPYSFLPRGGRR